MNKISISEAWAYATSFFNGQHPNHAIALIGMGIVGPLLLNLAMGGGAAMNPAAFAGGPDAVLAMGGSLILIGLLGFILQSGSYFASWRLGLMPGKETIGSALGYGLVAALPVLLLTVAFILLIGIVAGIVFGASLMPLLAGGQPTDAGAAGAGIMMLLGLPLFLLFLLWLSARFSCMGPIMAHGRTFNPLPALAESWRMTAASQWKLMGYFVLLAIVIFIIAMIVGMIAGVGAIAGGDSGAGFGFALVLSSLIGIPIAYLYVGVPAGIYRALGGGNAGDVFA